jgi:hypothetical protein
MSKNADYVTITLDRHTAHLVQGALIAYRSSVEHVLADLRTYDSDERAEVLLRLAEARIVVERALMQIDSSGGEA